MLRSLLCSLASLVLIAAAPGCGISHEPPPAYDGSAPEPPTTCSVMLAPDEALTADVEAAALRWSAATGCSIEASDAGVPIVIVASIVRPDGTQAPGMTTADRDRVEVNVRMRGERRRSTVLHELGHLLGGEHVESDGVLSGDKGRRDVIDGAALDSVCSRLDCAAVSPEAP